MNPRPDVLVRHHVVVDRDSPFQAELRLRQALWREACGLPIGDHRGRPLGSRIAMPYARDTLSNYLTPTVRDVVRREVLDPVRSRGKVFAKPRIFEDLLSSQPMSLNLFGELAADPGVASRVFSKLWPERVARVATVDFEWSPGRDDPRYLGNRSAFDVFVRHSTPGGGRGFIGIEVKYHEDLSAKPSAPKDRYDGVADESGVFVDPASPVLRRRGLHQIWLDHLLALSMLRADGWESGMLLFLFPAGNRPCVDAAATYRRELVDQSTFVAMGLERFIDIVRWSTDADWVAAFTDRYLRPSADRLRDVREGDR